MNMRNAVPGSGTAITASQASVLPSGLIPSPTTIRPSADPAMARVSSQPVRSVPCCARMSSTSRQPNRSDQTAALINSKSNISELNFKRDPIMVVPSAEIPNASLLLNPSAQPRNSGPVSSDQRIACRWSSTIDALNAVVIDPS